MGRPLDRDTCFLDLHLPQHAAQRSRTLSGKVSSLGINLVFTNPVGSPMWRSEDRRRQVQAFCAIIQPHIPKCESIFVRCYEDAWEIFVGLLTVPAARLKFVSLEVWEQLEPQSHEISHKEPPPLKLLGGDVAHLVSLYLQYLGLDWPSMAFQGLLDLELDSMYHNGPSVRAITTLIQNCPSLENIYLSEVYPSFESAFFDHTSIMPIDLPRLSTLGVHDCPLDLTEGVFKSIKSMPQCTRMNLSLALGNDVDENYLCSTFHDILPDLQRLFRGKTREQHDRPNLRLKLYSTLSEVSWCSDPAAHCDFSLDVDGWESSRVAVVRLVASLLEHSDVNVSLAVCGNGLEVQQVETDLLRGVHNLPVTQLCLEDMEDWQSWLSHLSSFFHYTSQHQTVSHPFKNVTRLTLSEDDPPVDALIVHQTAIHSMLRERYSKVGSSTLDLSDETLLKEYCPPMALENLTYKARAPMSKDIVSGIEKILGPDIFQYVTVRDWD